MQYKQSWLSAQKRWLEPLLFRQSTKVFHLLNLINGARRANPGNQKLKDIAELIGE